MKNIDPKWANFVAKRIINDIPKNKVDSFHKDLYIVMLQMYFNKELSTYNFKKILKEVVLDFP